MTKTREGHLVEVLERSVSFVVPSGGDVRAALIEQLRTAPDELPPAPLRVFRVYDRVALMTSVVRDALCIKILDVDIAEEAPTVTERKHSWSYMPPRP